MVTRCVAPGARVSRAKPRSCCWARTLAAPGRRRYNCATSVPVREPVFSRVKVAVTVGSVARSKVWFEVAYEPVSEMESAV